jgi:uncharacterized protein (TIGR03435 family)
MNMRRYVLLALLPVVAFGQTARERAFEAASIKPYDGPLNRIDDVTTSGQRLIAYAADMRYLVMCAYDLKGFQITGTAPLFQDGDTRWDIQAKAEGDRMPTRAEFRQMLQSLLADRFQLKVHHEMREMPVYALVAGKNGPKLKDADPNADATGLFSQQGRNMVITLPKASMSDIVDALNGTAFVDRAVVDHTGLTGTYNVKLTYTPSYLRYNGSTPDVDDIDIFQAVEKQLGLKLEPRKEPVDMLVVDRVEKPSAN